MCTPVRLVNALAGRRPGIRPSLVQEKSNPGWPALQRQRISPIFFFPGPVRSNWRAGGVGGTAPPSNWRRMGFVRGGREGVQGVRVLYKGPQVGSTVPQTAFRSRSGRRQGVPLSRGGFGSARQHLYGLDRGRYGSPDALRCGCGTHGQGWCDLISREDHFPPPRH